MKVRISFYALLFLLFIAFSAVGQENMSTRIDFQIDNQDLASTLFSLSEKAKIPISFSDNFMDERTYSYAFRQKSVKYILKQILSEQNLAYRFQNGKILIFRKKNLIQLNGYIEDRESGERLIGANIYRSDQFGGTISNDYGFFSLTVPEDDIVLEISYLGYKTTSINVLDLTNATIKIELEQSLTFEEVIITDVAKQNSQRFAKDEIAASIVDNADRQPALGGEPDVMRSIMQLPAVQTGPDGFGGLFVRGGNADQNLVLLDGVPIYNPYHTLGIFSIFDHSMVRNIKFYSGEFPARYGGRISSVVDVRTKEGNNKEYQLEAGIGLLASKISLQGPIVKNKAAFIISARRTHLDPFLRNFPDSTIFNNRNGKLNYFFGEIIAKTNISLGENDRLYASFYTGSDDYKTNSRDTFTDLDGLNTETSEQELRWGNTLGVARWNHTFNSHTFTNLTLTYSEFKFRSSQRNGLEYNAEDEPVYFSFASAFDSKITSSSVKYDLDYIANNKHYLRAGAKASLNTFQPGITNFRDSTEFFSSEVIKDTMNVPGTETIEFNAYIEDDWKINKRWNLNFGLFSSISTVRGKTYFIIDPRIHTQFVLAKNLMLTASYNHMHQNLHLLSRSGSGFPNDLWVPSTDGVRPQQSRMVDFGLHWNITKSLKFSSNAFYKTMDNLIYFEERANFTTNGITASNWEDRIVNGNGEAKGIETSLRYSSNRINCWAHYTLSKTDRLFPDLNDGKVFPFKYDNRNKINLGATFNLSSRWSASAIWNFSSGTNITLYKSSWLYIDQKDFSKQIFIDYTNLNGYKLPSYHRLDLGLKYNFKGEKYNWSFDIGTYNSYARKNPFYIRPEIDPNNNKVIYKQIVLVPFLPYFNLNIQL